MSRKLSAIAAAVMVFMLGLVAPATSQAVTVPSADVATSAQHNSRAVQARKNPFKVCDRWDGGWLIYSATGDGSQSTLLLNLVVSKHERAYGNYTGSTNGFITGELQNRNGDPKPCGRRWAGRFVDQSGNHMNRGRFWAQLYFDSFSQNWHFYGQYKPCKVFCSWYNWQGSALPG